MSFAHNGRPRCMDCSVLAGDGSACYTLGYFTQEWDTRSQHCRCSKAMYVHVDYCVYEAFVCRRFEAQAAFKL